MTDTTPMGGTPAQSPVTPPAETPAYAQPGFVPQNRVWYHDKAAVVALTIAAGFIVTAVAFHGGWAARGVAEHVFGGRAIAAHGGFDRGDMMSGQGGYGEFEGRPGFAPRGPMGGDQRGGQMPCGPIGPGDRGQMPGGCDMSGACPSPGGVNQ